MSRALDSAARAGEQPPPDGVLRHSVRIAAGRADAADTRPFPTEHHKQDLLLTTFAVDPTVRAEQTTELQIQNRTLEMHLIDESLARAHMRQRRQEAEHERPARAVILRRKAQRASLRARRALAAVVL